MSVGSPQEQQVLFNSTHLSSEGESFFPLAIGIIVLIIFSKGNNLSILRSDSYLFFSWHKVWRILFYKHANIPLLSESAAATILRITSSKEQFSPVSPL